MSNKITPLNQHGEPLFTTRSRSLLPDQNGDKTRGVRSRMRLLSDKSSSFTSSSPSSTEALRKLTQDQTQPDFQDFLVTRYELGLQERYQIMQPLGDAEVVNYFGKAPIYLNLEGMLVDDIDNQWFLKFMGAYQDYLRGSQLARNRAMLMIYMPSMVIKGSILDIRISKDASRKVDVPFSLRILVRDLKFPEITTGLTSSFSKQKAQQLANDFNSSLLPSSITSQTSTSKTITASGGYTNQTGNAGYNLSSVSDFVKTTYSKFNGMLSNVTNAIGNEISPITNFATSTYNTASSFASSAYSSVSGALNTVESGVQATSNSVNGLLSKTLTPINQAISEGESIGLQIGAIVNNVEQGYRGAASQISSVVSAGENLKDILRSTTGTVGYLPKDFSQTVQTLVKDGKLSGAILNNSGLNSLQNYSGASNSELINNIATYNPEQGAKL